MGIRITVPFSSWEKCWYQVLKNHQQKTSDFVFDQTELFDQYHITNWGTNDNRTTAFLDFSDEASASYYLLKWT